MSSLTNLKKVTINGWLFHYTLPGSVTSFSLTYSTLPVFTEVKTLELLDIYTGENTPTNVEWIAFFNSLDGSSINTFNFKCCGGFKSSYINNSIRINLLTLSGYSSTWEYWNGGYDFSNLGNKLTNVKQLRVNYLYNMKDYSFFKSFLELEQLFINNNKASDIGFLDGMSTLEDLNLSSNDIIDISVLSGLSNLKNLSLANNNVSSLYALKDLKNLGKVYGKTENGIDLYGELNLENNCISDTSSFVTGTGEKVVFNNLNIIAGLNPAKGGNLTKVFLNGNEGIIDFNPVSSLKWTLKTGF